MEKGSLLLDRYEVIDTLGEGGFSRVVRALDTKMDREVAVKVIAASRKTAVRALREAKTVALLNHPNIVTLHEFEEDDNRYYLIMEYIRGRSLAEILDEYERLPGEMALAVGLGVCDALEYAHDNDVIHRDIKPANLCIVEEDGRVKVMDFGIARLKSAAKTGGATTEGDVVGTFAYMSPEQSAGEQIDERSDIFSMGVLLYKMATGRLPFEADTPAGTIYKIMNADPLPPAELSDDIPPAFSQTILKALAKSPDKRFRSAGELKIAFEHCRRSEETPAAVIRQGLAELTPPRKIEGLEDITAMRNRLSAWLREYRETITVTGFAAGCAATAVWSNAYLPALGTSLKLAGPILVFFSALFAPPLGLAAVLALVSAGVWQVSIYLGAAAIAIAALYWFVLGRAFPEFAILPLLAPALAWLQVPFLFPLAMGITFGPIMAGFLAGSGALILGAAELRELSYGWMIAGRPEMISAVSFTGEAGDISVFASYFADQPWLPAQAAVWAGVASLMSVFRTQRTKYSYWLASVIGIAGVWVGYRLAADAIAFKLDAETVLVRPLIFSVLVFLVWLFIFVHPARRS